jgi:hypothetical protein
VRRVLEGLGLAGRLPVRLITNGSLLHRRKVQEGILTLGELGGEVWFKLDRGTPAEIAVINGVPMDAQRIRRNLARCATLATTWVQTCWFALDGAAPDAAAREAYCAQLETVAPSLAGVHLYGLARPSLQPAAPRLQRLAADELEGFAAEIRKRTGLTVLVSP